MDAFTRVLQECVDKNQITGAAAHIVRRGETLYRGSVGLADRESGRPFAPDTINCMFSLTKMVIAVAALKLFEQGYYRLDDPIYEFIPAFRDATVVYPTENGPVVKPAQKPVTMRNLFTMTAGYPYPAIGTKSTMPAHYNYARDRITEAFARCREEAKQTGEVITTRKAAEVIASCPMCFEPGEGWLYGHCSDIMGAVVAEITGKKLAQVIRDEITVPLGMKDTAYTLSEEQKTRLAGIYFHFDPANVKKYDLTAEVPERLVSTPTEDLEICSSSLYSTLDDYSRFIQMLSRGGTLDGVKILGRKTVELMASDHLTPLQHAEFCRDWYPMGNATWGLMACVAKTLNHSDMMRFPGAFGWSGAAGTVAWADPKEELSVAFMVQRFPGDTEPIVTRLMQIAYSMI